MCRWRLEGGKKCNEHSLRAGFSEDLLTCSPLNVLYGKEYREPLQSKIKRPSKTKGFHGEHASHLFYLKSISFRGPGRRHNHPNSNNFSYLFFFYFFFQINFKFWLNNLEALALDQCNHFVSHTFLQEQLFLTSAWFITLMHQNDLWALMPFPILKSDHTLSLFSS